MLCLDPPNIRQESKRVCTVGVGTGWERGRDWEASREARGSDTHQGHSTRTRFNSIGGVERAIEGAVRLLLEIAHRDVDHVLQGIKLEHRRDTSREKVLSTLDAMYSATLELQIYLRCRRGRQFRAKVCTPWCPISSRPARIRTCSEQERRAASGRPCCPSRSVAWRSWMSDAQLPRRSSVTASAS